jgi:hypothetical protein
LAITYSFNSKCVLDWGCVFGTCFSYVDNSGLSLYTETVWVCIVCSERDNKEVEE